MHAYICPTITLCSIPHKICTEVVGRSFVGIILRCIHFAIFVMVALLSYPVKQLGLRATLWTQKIIITNENLNIWYTSWRACHSTSCQKMAPYGIVGIRIITLFQLFYGISPQQQFQSTLCRVQLDPEGHISMLPVWNMCKMTIVIPSIQWVNTAQLVGSSGTIPWPWRGKVGFLVDLSSTGVK